MNEWSVMVIAAAVIAAAYLISQYFAKEHMNVAILTRNNSVITQKSIDYPRGASVWCMVSHTPNGQASSLLRVVPTGEETGSVVVDEHFSSLILIHISQKQLDELTSQRMASILPRSAGKRRS